MKHSKSKSKLLPFFIVVILCFTNTQCDKDDDAIQILDKVSDCEQRIFIDEEYYNILESGFFTFITADVNEDCLSLEFAASGCDSGSWEFNLVDSGSVAESSPEQRFLKPELINNELCLAVFTKLVTFNLVPLRVEGSNEIILNIEGLDTSLTYTY